MEPCNKTINSMQSDKANGSYHGLSIYYLHLQMNSTHVHDTEDGTINMYPCWFQDKRKFINIIQY